MHRCLFCENCNTLYSKRRFSKHNCALKRHIGGKLDSINDNITKIGHKDAINKAHGESNKNKQNGEKVGHEKVTGTNNNIGNLVGGVGILIPDDCIDMVVSIMKKHPRSDRFNIGSLTAAEWLVASQDEETMLHLSQNVTSSNDKSSINIHLVGCHWVTSFKNNNTGQVHVFDSLLATSSLRSRFLKPQLELLYGFCDGSIVYETVTQQSADPLCGALATAFAFDILLGYKPADMRYDVSKARDHLKQVIRRNSVCRFPLISIISESDEISKLLGKSNRIKVTEGRKRKPKHAEKSLHLEESACKSAKVHMVDFINKIKEKKANTGKRQM